MAPEKLNIVDIELTNHVNYSISHFCFFLVEQMMAESAVFGAALGTGTALLIAVTIIMYKYYRLKQQTKAWHSLDQLPFPPVAEKSPRPFYPMPKTVRIM